MNYIYIYVYYILAMVYKPTNITGGGAQPCGDLT